MEREEKGTCSKGILELGELVGIELDEREFENTRGGEGWGEWDICRAL
jgi:hypothetical protein